MQRSLGSRLILAGVFTAAAAGWLGVRWTPSAGSQAAPIERPAEVAVAGTTEGMQPGVRNRAAWQPSPIPGKQAASQAQVVDAAPAQPVAGSPVGGAPAIPAGNPLAGATAPAIGGLGALVNALPALGRRAETVESIAPAAPATGFISISEQLSHNALEARFGGALPEQRGEWQEAQFFSRALGEQVAYMVWLPPGYHSDTTTKYPTLYLLHGVGGENGFGVEEWLGYALTEDLDRMLALGLIQPMIVILPNGEQGYWMNHADGGPKWGDFVALDLVRHVDATFRTDDRRERRAIGGLSMGGHGALQLALNHPDTFSIAGAHSPTLRPFEMSPEFFGDQQWFAKNDPVSLVRTTSAAPRIAMWIDVGADDQWREGIEELRAALAVKKAPVEFRVLEGEHEGWYWENYLPEYLGFYSSALYARALTPQGAPIAVTRPLVNLVAASPGS